MKSFKRKIIKQGVGGYTIYLPKDWVVERGLQPGDEIFLLHHDSALLLTSEKKPHEKSVVVHLHEAYVHPFVEELIGLYESGFNEIIITFQDPLLMNLEKKKKENILTVVEALLPRLIGFEMVTIKEKRIVLRDVAVTQAEDFDVIFRRIFYLFFQFADLLKHPKTLTMVEATSQYKTITKFISFCLRTLSFTQKKEQEKIHYVSILHSLDKIADSYLFLAEHYPHTLTKHEKELLGKVLLLLPMFSDAFYEPNDKTINALVVWYSTIKRAVNQPKRNLNDIVVQFAQVNEYVQSMIKPLITLYKLTTLPDTASEQFSSP